MYFNKVFALEKLLDPFHKTKFAAHDNLVGDGCKMFNGGMQVIDDG